MAAEQDRGVQLGTRSMEDALDEVRRSPADDGRVALIVRRPGPATRDVVDEAELDTVHGLVGDSWRARGSRRTDDGSADPDKQLTLMSARVAAFVAGGPEAWPAAGDQLYVDLDLSEANLPPGTRVQIGTAVIELTAAPHRGCAKFAARFGQEAVRFVNAPAGRGMRLRGANAKVVVAGTVRTGDAICVLRG